MTRIMLFILFVISIFSSNVNSIIFTNEQERQIELFANSLMSCKQTPGLTVAVVKGEEAWTKGLGTADLDDNRPVVPDTKFMIGSISKGFTSTLIGIYIDRSNGRYSWNSKVKDILGADFSFSDEYRNEHLTIKDLLTHRTGLDYQMLPLFAGTYEGLTTSDFAKRFKYVEALDEFRDVYQYNNLAYGLAGHVVEVLSGMSYADALEENIFKPLGMSDSGVASETLNFESTSGFAIPYMYSRGEMVRGDEVLYRLHPAEAAGSVVSTATDMTKWLQFLLRGGKTQNDVTLIDPMILNEAFNSHIAEPEDPRGVRTIRKPTFPVVNEGYGYGYGWSVATYRGYQKIAHGGTVNSFQSYIQFYPSMNVGIFTSINGPGSPEGDTLNNLMGYFISDMLLRENTWLDTTSACTFPSPWVNAPPTPQPDYGLTNKPIECLQCFIGTYGHYFHGDLEVKVEELTGDLQIKTGFFWGKLLATSLSNATLIIEFQGPFELLSRPGNITAYFPITFSGFEKGRFTNLLVDRATFVRGRSFYNTIKQTENKWPSSSSQNRLIPSSIIIIIHIVLFSMFK